MATLEEIERWIMSGKPETLSDAASTFKKAYDAAAFVTYTNGTDEAGLAAEAQKILDKLITRYQTDGGKMKPVQPLDASGGGAGGAGPTAIKPLVVTTMPK